MHSVTIACTITTLITTYIYIASFKVQLSQQLHCSVSYRWGYLNRRIQFLVLALTYRSVYDTLSCSIIANYSRPSQLTLLNPPPASLYSILFLPHSTQSSSCLTLLNPPPASLYSILLLPHSTQSSSCLTLLNPLPASLYSILLLPHSTQSSSCLTLLNPPSASLYSIL